MGDHTAFFYGTLMENKVLARVLHGTSSMPISHLDIEPAILHDHCRYKVAGCDYPGVIPHENSTVRGVYVSGLSSYDMTQLDIFEGDQYERKVVLVRRLEIEGDVKGQGHVEGDEVPCETYVFVAGDDLLEKKEWCFEEFVKEKLYRWADESSEYADLDNAVVDEESAHDPTGGRGVHTDMSNKLKGKEVAVNGDVIESAV